MTLEEMEKRLRLLEDVEEIKQLNEYYVQYFNPPVWGKIEQCFSKDAVLDVHAGTVKGREEIRKLLTENVSQIHAGVDEYFVVHPRISVSGDKAKGSWLLVELIAKPRKYPFKLPFLPSDYVPDWISGYQEVEYVREDGKWKISLMHWRATIFRRYTKKWWKGNYKKYIKSSRAAANFLFILEKSIAR